MNIKEVEYRFNKIGFTKSESLNSLKVKKKEGTELRYAIENEYLGIHISETNKGESAIKATINLIKTQEPNILIKVLYLARNKIETFTIDTQENHLRNLEYLNISENNELSELSIWNPDPFKLSDGTYSNPRNYLKVIDASFCKNLEKVIIDEKFQKLEKLDVQNCNLKQLILPKKLTSLVYFNFSNNQINETKFLNFLENDVNDSLKEGGLIGNGNTLLSPALRRFLESNEEKAQQWEGILLFLSLKKEKISRNKLILLGNTQSGKSSFCGILDKTKIPSKSTHGVNIFTYTTPKNNIYQIFDFGGQDFYHQLHLAYFGENAKYLLIYGNEQEDGYTEIDEILDKSDKLNLKIPRKEQLFPINYWLESIPYYLNQNSNGKFDKLEIDYKFSDQIGVVYTNSDAGSQTKHYTKSLKECYFEKNIIVGLLENLTLNKSKNELNRKDLVNNFGVCSFEVENLFPESPFIAKEKFDMWLDQNANEIEVTNIVLKWEQHFKANPNLIIVSKYYFVKSLDSNGEIIGDDEFENLEVIIQYLKSTNIIYNIEDSLDSRLNEKFIVNLNTFSNWIYNILSINHVSSGYIGINEAENALPDEAKEHVLFIFAFMEHHKLIFKIDIGTAINSAQEFLVPQFRPEPEYPADKILLNMFDSPLLKYEFVSFYHTQILTTIIKNYFDKINENNFGKDGIEVAKEQIFENSELKWRHLIWKNKVILQFNKPNNKPKYILIKFDFPNKEEIIFPTLSICEIPNEKLGFEELDEIYRFIDKELIKNFTSYKKLIKTPNETYINCNIIEEKINSLKTVESKANYRDLIYGTEDQCIYRISDFPLFANKSIYPMKKIFISYSKDDVIYREEFKKFFGVLIQNGVVDTFDDSELLFGGWNPQIIQKIKECDIMVCLVSPDFLTTDYIRNHELPLAYKERKLIVPIIVRACPWENFTFLSEDEDNKKVNVKLSENNASLKAQIISLDSKNKLKANEERDSVWTDLVNEFERRIRPEN